MLSDLRFAFRQLAKFPGFTVVALLTLGLGIGTCTAIFSVVNSVLLRPMPFAESNRLVIIWETNLPQFPTFSVAPGNYYVWYEQAKSFENLAAARSDSYTLTAAGEPARLNALRVTANFFSMLRVKPQLGRDFRPEEDLPGAETVVLLNHRFWQNHFGGRADVLGQTMQLDGRTFNIIGVLPESYREADVVTPAAYTTKDRQQHGDHHVRVIGRLKDGVALATADAELKVIAERLAVQFPESNKGWSVRTALYLDNEVGEVRPVLLALQGAVGFLLLIACANIANLLLARASSRTKEIAIRVSQGAGPARIVRQMLTESTVIALLGGVLGACVAQWGVSVLLAMAPDSLPRADEITVDGRALFFTGTIALFTGIVFGLVPALQAARINVNLTLKDTARGAGGRRSRFRSALVITEIALALVLLVGSGLLIRSFARLTAVNPGFDPHGVFRAGLNLPGRPYSDGPRVAAFVQQATAAIGTLPGVQTVGTIQVLPFSGNDYILDFYREDQARPAPGTCASANYYSVTSDYFKAMGIRLRRGRFFDAHDVAGSAPVALISETMAKRYFAGTDPIGRRINITNGPETWREIVGIVDDTKHYGLDGDPLAQMYEPFAQNPFPFFNLVIRTQNAQLGLPAAVRAAIQSIDPNQPIANFDEMETLLTRSVGRQRFSAVLFAVFSGMALLLATIGIYGVMAYSVSQRTGEFGIRMALGAQRGDVLRLVLAQGGRLIALGVCCGLVGALLLTRFIASMLFDVGAYDPFTFGGIAALLAAVASLACYVPARRATRVDPMIALRAE